MKVTADASFLVSLYGGDVNSPATRHWMMIAAEPVLMPGPLRFETENALRLACYRGKISLVELQRALIEIEADLNQGILVAVDVASNVHWEECRRLSHIHTLHLGMRSYDIAHVAAARIIGADTFLSFDLRQPSLAMAEGFTVAPT